MKIFAALALVFVTGAASAANTVQLPRDDGKTTALSVYAPAASNGCPPLALLSPGAGGSEQGLSWLAQDLQQQGFLAVVVGHLESGLGVLKSDMRADGFHGGLLTMTTDSSAYRARFMDIGVALHWAQARCNAPFRVLLGHSMGAATSMLEAGASNKLGLQAEDRFDAYVALSPQGPGSVFPERAWHGIHKPVLMLTGTRDKALEGDWHTRTIPYADLPGGCQWLGVIDGATHMNFAGNGLSGSTERLAGATINAFLQGAPNGRCALPALAKGLTLQSK